MFNYKNTFKKNYIEHHAINELGHFINAYYMDKKYLSLCDELIKNHVHETKKFDFYGNQSSELEDHNLSIRLDEQLYFALNNYAEKYPASVIKIPGITEKCIVQSSEDGKPWNSIETVTVTKDIRRRHIGFVLFLNDSDQGGGLAFYHQKLLIQPRKGLIVFYPDNWQHIFSIEPSEKELYWITGHISNVTEDEKAEYAPKLKMTPSQGEVNYRIV